MALPDTNITISAVRNEMGETVNDLTKLCTSSKMNTWSIKKPHTINVDPNDYYFEVSLNSHGLYRSKPYGYVENLLPKGGSTDPYRLGDFRGYDHDNSEPPSYLNITKIETDDGEPVPIVDGQFMVTQYIEHTFFYRTYKGNGGDDGDGLRPEDIYSRCKWYSVGSRPPSSGVGGMGVARYELTTEILAGTNYSSVGSHSLGDAEFTIVPTSAWKPAINAYYGHKPDPDSFGGFYLLPLPIEDQSFQDTYKVVPCYNGTGSYENFQDLGFDYRLTFDFYKGDYVSDTYNNKFTTSGTWEIRQTGSGDGGGALIQSGTLSSYGISWSGQRALATMRLYGSAMGAGEYIIFNTNIHFDIYLVGTKRYSTY